MSYTGWPGEVMVKKLKMQNFIYTVLFSVLQYQYNGDKDFFSFSVESYLWPMNVSQLIHSELLDT